MGVKANSAGVWYRCDACGAGTSKHGAKEHGWLEDGPDCVCRRCIDAGRAAKGIPQSSLLMLQIDSSKYKPAPKPVALRCRPARKLWEIVE